MYDIFFIGDFSSDNGPGIANKSFRIGYKITDPVLFSDAHGKLSRVIEMIKGIIKSKNICLCSSSKANVLCITLAKIMKKRVVYLMHGYLYYEALINGQNDAKQIEKVKKFEQYLFRSVDKIICVSPNCAEHMKKVEQKYRDKFCSIYNAVNISIHRPAKNKESSEEKIIVSLGGGMPQKNNLDVCRALELLQQQGMKLKYVVIGLPYTLKQELCKFDFVEYYDSLPHNKVMQILSTADLYVQNSLFETFGMAPIEALYEGCSLLLSSGLGMISVFDCIDEKCLIKNPKDIEEIANKIESILEKPNVEYLTEHLRSELLSPESVAKELSNIVVEYDGYESL